MPSTQMPFNLVDVDYPIRRLGQAHMESMFKTFTGTWQQLRPDALPDTNNGLCGCQWGNKPGLTRWEFIILLTDWQLLFAFC